jgi:LacI family sucrose operon transcriptional repressor
MGATLKEIALKVGVNVSTVSRVLNNRGYISKDLRDRVDRAITELDYHPNEIARSLFRKKSNVIGLVIPTVAHPFFGELCESIEKCAYQKNYRVLICNSQHERDKENSYLKLLRANQVDGIILGSHTLDVSAFITDRPPLVTIDRRVDSETPFVSSDNYSGGRLATELLISKGCKKLALIMGNRNLPMLANLRADAFEDITTAYNIPHVTMQTHIMGFDPIDYDEITNRLLREHPDVDGIFTTSDLIASHVMRICQNAGKRIPEDIKIIGYDGVFFGELISPQLTTIRQPIPEMGALAFELLFRLIDKLPVSQENTLPVSLIERGST